MKRIPIGYQVVRECLGLRVPDPECPAYVDAGVNRRTDAESALLFPPGVAVEDTPLGHLEFGLRNEGVNLALIAAALERIKPAEIETRLAAAPNSEYARRLGFLWEWLHPGQTLRAKGPAAKYVELFPSADYVVAGKPERHSGLRVLDNALGDARFCPVIRRADHPGDGVFEKTLEQAQALIEQTAPRDYERASQYLYLSETRGSFAIEKDTPDANRVARFIRLLRHAGDRGAITEQYLVKIQNAVVKHDFAKETSYRTQQNWLSRAGPFIDFFPPPPEQLRSMMAGWERFANDDSRGLDLLTHVAAASFGFVYLHPFMDGNGRVHRFLIHKMLACSGRVEENTVIPVSAVILNHLSRYSSVLRHFSEPATALWNYRLPDERPQILTTAEGAVYRYPECGREIQFLNDMTSLAVSEEMPREIRWLSGFDAARARIEAEFDLPDPDINTLIRVIHQHGNRLSQKKRKQFWDLPDSVLARIEEIVAGAFSASEQAGDKPGDAKAHPG